MNPIDNIMRLHDEAADSAAEVLRLRYETWHERAHRDAVFEQAQKDKEALRAVIEQLHAENESLHRLLAWIFDECHIYPESAAEKAFARRLLSAITHPKSGPPKILAQGEKT